MAFANVDLDTLKAFLGYTTGGSPSPVDPRDPTLTMYLNAGIATLKKLMGRHLERLTYRDTLSYQPQRVHLREWPIESISSVQINGVDVPAADYQVFYDSGYIYFKNRCQPVGFANTPNFLTIEYVAGYTYLPDDLLLAVFSTIQSVDVSQKQLATSGGILKRVSVYDVGVTDYYIPKEGSTSSMFTKTMEPLLGPYIASGAGDLGAPLLHEVEIVGPAP